MKENSFKYVITPRASLLINPNIFQCFTVPYATLSRW